MGTYLKDRWVLLVVLLIFAALKLPHLSYPFFWDESWVYAPAVKEMYRNGPSLLPTAISTDLSRGHPLLFHFLTSGWMRIFGASNIAMHTFPLLVAITLLVTVYEIGMRFFDKRTAIAALLFIASQVIFFVQSAFVFLEIFLALTVVLSIWFYSRKKYGLTIAALAAVYFTKESGMILGVVLGVDALITLFKKNETVKHKIWNIVSVIVPALLIGLFFILQKKQLGWYMYPYHTGLIEVDWPQVYDKLRLCVKFLFRDDNRKYLFVLICALSVAAAIIKKSLRFAAPVVAAPFIFLVASDQYHDVLPYYITFPLFVASIFFVLHHIRRAGISYSSEAARFLILSVIFILCFTIYSSCLIYIVRYLIVMLVLLLIIAAVILGKVTAINKWLYIPVLAIVLALQAWAFRSSTVIADTSLGAFDAMKVQQAAVTYLEDHNYYDKHIAVTQYLQWVHLLDENTGFKKDTIAFKHVSWTWDVYTEMMLFDNIESKIDTAAAYKKIKAHPDVKLLYRASKGKAWTEIYGLR